jgi:hypothetical protein
MGQGRWPLWLLAMGLFAAVCDASAVLRRPAGESYELDFEGLAKGRCDFSDSTPLSSEYAAAGASFSGPGFGNLNGGVALDACALSGGAFPPLGNNSVSGRGFVGFSTLHVFKEHAGKPISPETIRFDVKVTNIAMSFAGIDEHEVEVQLWSGPQESYDDGGVLLHTATMQMTSKLKSFNLVNENKMFVDCVRRIVISSPAKIFVLDNLLFEISLADEDVCKIQTGEEDGSDGEEELQTGGSRPSRGRNSNGAPAAFGSWAVVAALFSYFRWSGNIVRSLR